MMYRDEEGDNIIFNVETKKRRVVLGVDNEQIAEGAKFDLSADGKFMLVAREFQKIFRHSFAAFYDIVNLETKQVLHITVDGKQDPLVYAEWSPVGNSLIFVHYNNLFYKASPTSDEIRITSDGNPSIYNGIPDWVYEEEIFSSNKAMWFSPKGDQLTFIKFNDTDTPILSLPVYGPPGSPEFQYTKGITIHYPKSGSNNPTVRLFHVNLLNLTKGPETQLTEMEPPESFKNIEHIITTVSWSDNENVISTWMNRVQNKAIIQNCVLSTCRDVKELESKTGWIELFSSPLFSKDGKQIAIIASQEQVCFLFLFFLTHQGLTTLISLLRELMEVIAI